MLNNFLKNFPPPEYLNVPYTGIVFSDNSIRVLTLNKKNKHPVFLSETTLEPGIIEMGKVKNEEVLSKILREKRANLKTPFIKFSIPDETSYVFTAKVPVVPGKDAKESIGFILEENVPLPLSDISFDFGVQKIKKTEAGYFVEVAIIATSTSLITAYVNSLQKADLEPLACINESQATVYSVVPKGKAVMSVIIHVHKQSAGIYIANNHLVEFSGIIPISLTDPIELSIKLIKAEFERAIDYWSTKMQKTDSKTDFLPCYLCGEYEIVKNLSEQIYQIPNVRPSVANVWLNAFSIDQFVPDISFEESLRFASAVGLFLSD